MPALNCVRHRAHQKSSERAITVRKRSGDGDASEANAHPIATTLSWMICLDMVGMGQVHLRERLARSRGETRLARSRVANTVRTAQTLSLPIWEIYHLKWSIDHF